MKKIQLGVKQVPQARLRPLIHRSTSLAWCGQRLDFYLSQALFSAHDVDDGSRLLLKVIARQLRIGPGCRILDVGCGVGVLGLCIAKASPGARLWASDRDALALEVTRANGWLNKVEIQNLLGELGIAAGLAPMDLIVSNIPAKIGPQAMARWVADGWRALAPGGTLALVVIQAYAGDLASGLEAAGIPFRDFGEDPRYRVFLAAKPDPAHPAPGLSPPSPAPHTEDDAASRGSAGFRPGARDVTAYLRGQKEFSLDRLAWKARCSFSLPEFDTLSWQTVCTLRGMTGLGGRRLLFWNPGQGHLALAALRLFSGIESLTLAGRDLLALELSAANLREAGLDGSIIDLQHVWEPGLAQGSWDSLVVQAEAIPQSTWEPGFMEGLAGLCQAGGRMVIGASSTVLTRLEQAGKGLWLAGGRSKYRGFACGGFVPLAPPGNKKGAES